MSNTKSFHNIQAVVTDIEGTTSSISFVKDVLFPYAAEHMAQFIQDNQTLSEVTEQLNQISQEQNIDRHNLEGIIEQLLEWIKQDVKATPLKALQGLIWEAGYKNGSYQAHMYDDATEVLKIWHASDLPIYVYSSGSIYAQKLFYGYSEAGNLLPLFSGHFDTTIGHKQECESYQAIQLFLDVPADSLLFLSDIEGELDAAKAAGFQTCHIIRDSNLMLEHSQHIAVRSFADIQLETP